MTAKLTINDCFTKLSTTGWSPNMAAMRQSGKRLWYVCGHRMEQTILGRGPTRADAWRAAVMAAESSVEF